MEGSGAGYSQRRVRPAKPGDVVDLGAKFGVTMGSDSDSSDAEFAPEDEEQDSEDSRDSSDEEEGGEEGDEGGDAGKVQPSSSREESEAMETEAEKASEQPDLKVAESEAGGGVSGKGGSSEGVSDEDVSVNPLLIVRRSQRVIKPTKDIDLYLLSAQFGVTLDDSDGEESSDMEFAPAENSDVDSLTDSSAISRDGEEGEGEEKEGDVKVQSEDELDVSRSVSEFSIMQEAPQTKTIEIPLCCVCLEDGKGEEDIVTCDHCGISVHEGCYGVPEDDGVDDTRSDLSSFTTVPWFCDACKAGIMPITCELCPNFGGLFKQTVNGRWVHMVCGLYTPGIEYVEPDLLSGVTLDSLPAAKWGAKACQLCEDERFSRTGVCIGCDAGLCKSFFHVTCAQQHGLLCEVDSDDENEDLVDPYFAHCKAHSNKDIVKRKRRDYLTVMSKQKKFKYDDTDERIQQHLSEMRKEYLAFFRKMQQYYQPENVNSCKPEERLLHNAPSAFRRLTQKAQLLGYITEVTGTHTGEMRRRIAPKLTCEFVNYFTERLSRMCTFEEQQKGLRTTNSELKEEELHVKLQLAQVERELNSLRVLGHELKCQATAIYTNITRITSKDLTIPEFLADEEDKGEPEDEKDKPKCSICKQSRYPHMMALCDTCKKRYHINCLDPPLSKVPKKSTRWGWQCHECCFSSGDELVPTIAGWDEHASRCGRKIQPPKVLCYPEDQVKASKKKSKSKKSKK